MKISKLFANTLQSKTDLIFFAAIAGYNLLLGFYLKDFFVLSPMLLAFYLLSALPTLFFVIRIRSNAMRAIVYILLIFVLGLSAVSFVCCRRFLTIMTMLEMVVMLMYLALSYDSSDKDKLLTKIYVLAVATLIVTTLFASYNFVFKPEAPYLSNGRDTLWDTQTEELADEICVGCDTDEEKVQAFYQWIIQNFEYDYECNLLIQYFDVRKTLRTKQGLCFDFAHLFAAFCRSQNIPCYSADRHTWNRVYFDGSWWNLDITADNSRTANGKELYGFHELECAFVPDEDFFITKIY